MQRLLLGEEPVHLRVCLLVAYRYTRGAGSNSEAGFT